MKRHHTLTALILVVIGSLGAACGDNEGTSREGSGAPSSASPTTEPFCSTIVETFTTTNRAFATFDFTTATPRDIGRFLRDMSARLEPLYQELEASVPEEIADVAARRLAVARRALRTGIEDDSPKALQDERALDEFVLTRCHVHRASTVLTDGGIDVPGDAPDGVVAFELSNESSRPHYFGVYAVPEAIADLPIDELATRTSDLQRVGGSDIGTGQRFATFVDLEAGRYLVGDPDAELLTELRVG